MSPRRFQRLTALLLVHALTVVPLLLLAPAFSAEVGTQFHGRVFEADGITPLQGYAVALVDADTEQVYRSRPTGDDGSFAISDAPSGTYVVLAETDGGAYKASDAVKLQEGGNPPVALSVNTLAPGQSSAAARSGLPVWGKWVIFGAIGVAALFLINDSGDDNEENASEF